MHPIDRRTFLKTAATAAVGTACLPGTVLGADQVSEIIVVHGKDPAAMLAKGIARLGGWATFIKRGDRVTVKPNAAWASTPRQAGNTNPDLVKACVRACRNASGKTVIACENTCSPDRVSFRMSGIGDAVKEAGGRLYRPTDNKHFRRVSLPGAKVLKKADVAVDVLDCDCLINMPVAKSHGGSTLTISMKNWMGSVRDRGRWHRDGLHQCIADFSTFIKPQLIIVDATRIMLTNGPQGPGKVAHPDRIILGKDPVAMDAYAATLFDMKPFDVEHIRMGHEMGIGCGDLSKIKITELKV